MLRFSRKLMVSALLAATEVAMEYAAVQNDGHCPKGMYVIPSTESILIWDAVLFVHQGMSRDILYIYHQANFTTTRVGYYADAMLKFQIRFPTDYPSRMPTVAFSGDVFHPLISPKGGLMNLSPRFSSWK